VYLYLRKTVQCYLPITIFDLSTITDFEWDSVLLFRGNESVPISEKQIEPILKRKATELPTFVDRFYFLTSDKKIIIKEIKSGIHSHKPEFDIESCLPDSSDEWFWFSRKECKFILKSNSRKIGQGSVILFPRCNTKFSPDSIRFFKE